MAKWGSSMAGNDRPRQLPPAETLPAILYGIYDLGTVTEKDFETGAPKATHKFRLQFELPTETIKEGDYAGKPLAIGIDLTASFHEKASLHKYAVALRGKPFTQDELDRGIDPKSLLGKQCALTIVHKVSKASGNPYAKIASVAPTMKGVPAQKQTNPNVAFFIDEWDDAALMAIPKWVKETILSSPEARAMGKTGIPSGGGSPPASGAPADDVDPF